MSRLLQPGELAPWFHAAALSGRPRFAFNTVGGHWVVMLFAGSAGNAAVQPALRAVADARALFDDRRCAFFGVTTDPADAAEGRIAQHLPGIRWFLDYDRAVSLAYGALATPDAAQYDAHWLLLDPMMRVRARAPLDQGPAFMAAVRALLDHEPPPVPAPVLCIPEVFPHELCRHLIGLYEANGGEESGFMVEVDGITTQRLDPSHKRRADYTITDPQLIAALKQRLHLTLKPMIHRAFQFDATRIERFIVACYDAADGGHFRRHRDNTTAGTAHRRFACTINLNAEDYDGGDLTFPEFGERTYRAPTGGAVVFSCSLLHEAQPVTRGRRYAFLPFLYDDAAALVREANLDRVTPDLKGYRAAG